MARIQQVIDDLTGASLDEEVEPTAITMDGKEYHLDLGEASKDRLFKWLNGEDSLIKGGTSTSGSSTSSSKGTGKKTDTYGYDYAEVKTWAIANGIKAANGNPVKETTPRLGQSVYDAYKGAQAKK